MTLTKALLSTGATLTVTLAYCAAGLAITGCGEDDPAPEKRATKAKPRTPKKPKFVGTIDLERIDKLSIAYGKATILKRDGKTSIVVQAMLTPNRPREAYEVWLYNTQIDAKSLGASRTDEKGEFSGAAKLPAGYGRYRYIDVSTEPIDNETAHSGKSVLRGKL